MKFLPIAERELRVAARRPSTYWLRFAMPFSIGDTKWLMRASLLTLNTVPAAPEFEHETGLGDFNVFAAYQMDVGTPGVSFGVGPLLNIPTASEDASDNTPALAAP